MGKGYVGRLPDLKLHVGQLVYCRCGSPFTGHVARLVGNWVVVAPIIAGDEQWVLLPHVTPIMVLWELA